MLAKIHDACGRQKAFVTNIFYAAGLACRENDMEISTRAADAGTVAVVDVDRIDAAGAAQFKDQMRAIVEQADRLVVLDLSGVNFVDSSGLGAIVASAKFLSDTQKLALAGLTPTVQRVFSLTRLDTVFDIYASADEATSQARNAG